MASAAATSGGRVRGSRGVEPSSDSVDAAGAGEAATVPRLRPRAL